MDDNTNPSTNNYEVIAPQQRLEGAKAAMERSQCEAETGVPSLKVARNGAYSLVPENHPALMSALGANDWHFYEGVIKQAVDAGWTAWGYNEVTSNWVLSVVKGIEPRDQLEAMIGLQMGAIQCAIMRWAPELIQAPTPEVLESLANAVSKLTRTYAAGMDTLKRYRSKGEQKVTVQHVSVQDGGQAIVSQNVSRAGRGPQKKQAAAPASALTDTKIAPMGILEENRDKNGAEAPAAADAKK